jgi:DNA-binding PadR family transcriptional regulator
VRNILVDIWEKSPRVWNLPPSRHGNRFAFDMKLILILSLLREFSELSGYGLHKKIKERSGIDLSYGSIYPSLHLFISQGLITSRVVMPERSLRSPQRLYSLTESGENQLDVMLSFLNRLQLSRARSVSQQVATV